METVLSKKENEDKRISMAVMSSFAILTIQYLILTYFNLTNTNIGKVVQLASKIVVGYFYLLALPPVLKRNKIKFIGIYFVALFVFVFNYAFFNENWIYLKSIIFPLFFTGLPSFIYAYSIRDWDILLETMKKTSKLVFIVGIMISILVFTGNTSIGTYSMSLSYYMLLPAIVYMNDFIDDISMKNGLFLVISLLVILALGSRGAIMCIGVFTILKAIRSLKDMAYIKLPLYLMTFFLTTVGFIFSNEIFEYLYNLLLDYGIQSRSISLFLRSEVYLSGRDRLYKDVLQQIFNNPFRGLGLAGDRNILGGGYVHNIFMEILSNFGIVMGMVIIIGLLILIKNCLFVKDIKKYNMVIIWLSIGLVHLLVSSSYLIDFKFWISIGLLARISKNKKTGEKEYEKSIYFIQ